LEWIGINFQNKRCFKNLIKIYSRNYIIFFFLSFFWTDLDLRDALAYLDLDGGDEDDDGSDSGSESGDGEQNLVDEDQEIVDAFDDFDDNDVDGGDDDDNDGKADEDDG